MKLFTFIIKKAMKPTVILTAGLLCAALIFMCASFNSSYGKADDYKKILSGFSTAKEGYEFSKGKSSMISDTGNEIYAKADKYINSHNNGGVPGVLPNSMVDELLEARSASYENSKQTYTIMSKQLYSQAKSYELISERVEGYSRNIRRGVKDEYSLKTAELMTDDYTEVLHNEESSDTVYDTRAADNFTDFLSSEIISYIGIFMLTFSVFSSELQSRRFASIRISAYGAKKYAAARSFTGLLQAAVFFTVFCFALVLSVLISSGSSILSMPVQYLKGFELSHLSLSFGGFILYVYAIKLIHLLALAAASMLISLISGKVIVSAFGSGMIFALCIAAGRLEGAAGQILSCDIIGMSNDINVIDLGGSPIRVIYIFTAAMIAFTLISFLMIILLSKRRRCYA
ncbi:MAG: hypothetical protein IJM87_00380 [Ruminococcus sp.]|nr:hypothetical protein [Ruminococcus sp.]